MKGSILLIDSEQKSLTEYTQVLSSDGYAVAIAASGQQAFDLLGAHHYDLIIINIDMPGIGSMELLRQVRLRHNGTPIIAITEDPSQRTLRKALEYKIANYLAKPLSSPLLLSEVKKHISGKRECHCAGHDEALTPEVLSEVEKIIARHRNRPGSLIPVLQETQEYLGYLPPSVQKQVAQGLRIPHSEVHGVVSFYSFFTMKPKGKHNVRVCLGTACYVKGAEEIVKKISEKLAIEVGGISEDKKFSLETVRCLGACGLAPVVVVNKDTHGDVHANNVLKLLEEYE